MVELKATGGMRYSTTWGFHWPHRMRSQPAALSFLVLCERIEPDGSIRRLWERDFVAFDQAGAIEKSRRWALSRWGRLDPDA